MTKTLDKSNDIDCEDGTWAPNIIGRRVAKAFKGKIYNGTVVSGELKAGNKHPTFHVFFDEDQSTVVFPYLQLKPYLVDDPGLEAVASVSVLEMELMAMAVAEMAVGDISDIYLSDVVSSREEMLKQPDKPEFLKAEVIEMKNMEDHEVMDWCARPKGARLIKSKFTYKRKRDRRGRIIKWKARLCAKGFTMLIGIDYFHSSSPVAYATAFRLLIVIALVEGMEISQGDIDGAFLNGDLAVDVEEPLYMAPPDGFEDPTGQGRVLRLKKSIYGLKNAAYCWHKALVAVLLELGYVAIDGSQCFWLFKDSHGRKALLAVHVDDYVHAFNDASGSLETSAWWESSRTFGESAPLAR